MPHHLDTMTQERREYLEKHHNSKLTREEVGAGYRFCCEWDGLLIHGSYPEAEPCFCLKEWKQANGFLPPDVDQIEEVAKPEAKSLNATDFLG